MLTSYTKVAFFRTIRKWVTGGYPPRVSLHGNGGKRIKSQRFTKLFTVSGCLSQLTYRVMVSKG